VAGLRNVTTTLLGRVAGGLGLAVFPERLSQRAEPRIDLAPSPALSIVANGPSTFRGRKLGVARSPDGLRRRAGGRAQALPPPPKALCSRSSAPKVGGVIASDVKR